MLLAWGDIINYGWLKKGPGGYYGFVEVQTGHGLLAAHTTVVLGPKGFEIPLPLFAIALLAFAFTILLMCCIQLLARRIR